MPAAITHFLQAERVMEKLNKQKDSISLNRVAFLWGAQGPDFLYCHRYLPWQHGNSLKEYAEKLHHEKPSKILTAMRDFYNTTQHDSIVLSYIFGFICHYGLDRVGHPFIHCSTQLLLQQQPNQNEEILHNQIESSLDVIMLRYEKAELPTDFNLKWTVPKNQPVQLKITDLYAYVLNRLYELKDSNAGLLQATNDCRLLFGLLNDRTTLKKTLIERFEAPKGKNSISCHMRGVSEGDEYDYANTLLADWNWPLADSLKRNESFFDLYENSITESIELIQNYLTAENLSELTNEIPFV